MPLLVFAPCKFHAEKVAGLRGQTPEPPSKRAKPHGAQPNREKAPTASPPTVTSPGHWQSVWKVQASLGIHRTSSQNELSAMATEAWTHPQRQENRDTGTSGRWAQELQEAAKRVRGTGARQADEPRDSGLLSLNRAFCFLSPSKNPSGYHCQGLYRTGGLFTESIITIPGHCLELEKSKSFQDVALSRLLSV